VELLRPELTKSEFRDNDDSEAEKMLAGEKVRLYAEFNKDAQEGAPVDFRVYSEGDNPKRDEPVAVRQGMICEGKAEAEWEYEYIHDPDNPLKEKPKFFFTVNSFRCKEERSGIIEVGMEVDIRVCDSGGQCISELEYTINGADGAEEKGTTGKDGRIYNENLLPGDYKICFNLETHKKPIGDEEIIDLKDIESRNDLQRVDIKDISPITCKAGALYLFVFDEDMGVSSR
jgi:hypothetical protein